MEATRQRLGKSRPLPPGAWARTPGQGENGWMRVRLLILLTLASAACKSTPAQSDFPVGSVCQLVEDGPGPAGSVPIRVETVASGLEIPWGIAFLPNRDVLVTERPGRIRLIREGTLVEQPVAVVDAVHEGEGGLLGIALHPGFAQNRLFIVYFTAQGAGGPINRIQRYRLSEDGLSASAERILLDGIPARRFHDGGRLRIGPDGMLYAGTGDAGEPDRSQDQGSPAGKVLRITPDGAIPQDNPIPGNPLFLLGLRNVQGFDWFDAETLAVADHGPSGEFGRRGHDEITIARKGENLGWPTIFGCEEREGLVTPAISWVIAVPPGGLALYTSDSIPEWKGSVLVPSLGARHLHRIVFDPADRQRVQRHEVYLDGTFGRLREAIMGPDGALYLTTSNCDGRGSCPPEKDRILKVLPAGG